MPGSAYQTVEAAMQMARHTCPSDGAELVQCFASRLLGADGEAETFTLKTPYIK